MGMHHGRPAIVLAAIILHSLTASVAAARNVALLVAVGQFRDRLLQSEQLLGTEADIDSMQRLLSERWGFGADDVRALRNEEATHDRILAEISALEQRSAPGDTVVIYFSGHGTSANAENNSFDLPYATGAWVPYDVDVSSLDSAQRTLIVGRRDLVPRLRRLDTQGRLVVVVSDSCYSGQVVREFGQTRSRSRYLRIVTRDLGIAHVSSALAPRPPPPPYPYQHVLLLSAASDSEAGADISTPLALQQAPTVDGRYHGAFTDALLRLLSGRLLRGQFNYAQAQVALTGFLEQRRFAQHPQLLPAIADDFKNVASQPFLGMHSSEGSSAPVPVASGAVLRVRLDAIAGELRARIAAVKGIAIVDQGGDLTVRQRGTRVRLLGPAEDPIADSVSTDPNLIKRIAAAVWLRRTLPAGSNDLGLRAETDPGSRGNTYVQCESFVFEARLEKPAYLMLLDLDSQGNVTVLYPTRAAEQRLLAPGRPQAIPSADPRERILVTPPFGTDEVAVLAFERRPAFFADLNGAQRFDADSSRATALARGLASVAGSVSVQRITVKTYPGREAPFCSL
jgi:hypothetical protein